MQERIGRRCRQAVTCLPARAGRRHPLTVIPFERCAPGLKPDERTALLLLGLGYSYREIAVRCGWTYTKTNRSIAEGRARLREQAAA